MKSLEQKLFEAHQQGRGCRLDAYEVKQLLRDDAIECRISNTAAQEAGLDEPGVACIPLAGSGETWSQFKKRLATD